MVGGRPQARVAEPYDPAKVAVGGLKTKMYRVRGHGFRATAATTKKEIWLTVQTVPWFVFFIFFGLSFGSFV
jgi:hypothetical protein